LDRSENESKDLYISCIYLASRIEFAQLPQVHVDLIHHFLDPLVLLWSSSKIGNEQKQTEEGSKTMVAGLSRLQEKSNRYQSKSTVSKLSVTANKGSQRLHTTVFQKGVARPRSPSVTNLPSSFLPERRYIVLTQALNTDGSIISDLSDPFEPRLSGVSRILDSFSCLCLGGETTDYHRREVPTRSISPATKKTRVVYQIASYGGRLNSKKLIEERRQSLPHNFFRPVPSCIHREE
jgi:hypothetical protein